jgi:hypothetical protein
VELFFFFCCTDAVCLFVFQGFAYCFVFVCVCVCILFFAVTQCTLCFVVVCRSSGSGGLLV